MAQPWPNPISLCELLGLLLHVYQVGINILTQLLWGLIEIILRDSWEQEAFLTTKHIPEKSCKNSNKEFLSWEPFENKLLTWSSGSLNASVGISYRRGPSPASPRSHRRWERGTVALLPLILRPFSSASCHKEQLLCLPWTSMTLTFFKISGQLFCRIFLS